LFLQHIVNGAEHFQVKSLVSGNRVPGGLFRGGVVLWSGRLALRRIGAYPSSKVVDTASGHKTEQRSERPVNVPTGHSLKTRMSRLETPQIFLPVGLPAQSDPLLRRLGRSGLVPAAIHDPASGNGVRGKSSFGSHDVLDSPPPGRSALHAVSEEEGTGPGHHRQRLGSACLSGFQEEKYT
ncbi:hypothetical protein ACFL2Q_14955, partial [Thermodesulfobacteriota bacterium]